MKAIKNLLLTALLVFTTCFIIGCGNSNTTNTGNESTTNPTSCTIQVVDPVDQIEYNTMLDIPKAILVDEDGNLVEGTVSILVKDPMGSIVATSYTKIKCRILGEYILTYSANNAKSVELKVTCGDFTAPVISLSNYAGGGVVNTLIPIPDITYNDSSEMDYDLTTLDLYYDNSGVLEPCEYNTLLNNFTPTKAGVYVLKSHAVDIHGNAADDYIYLNVFEPSAISFHYGEWITDYGYKGGVDYGNYLSLSTVEEKTRVASNVEISKYYQIHVNKHALNVGFKYQLDPSKLASAINVVYYVKADNLTALRYFPGEMNTVEISAIGGVNLGDYVESSVYDGWYKVSIPAQLASQIGTYCFVKQNYTDQITAGSDIYVSEPIYETAINPGYTWYYGVWEGGYITGEDYYFGYSSLSKVEENTQVEEGVIIDSYNKVEVNKDALHIGFKYGYDQEQLENATNVVYYVKSSIDIALVMFSGLSDPVNYPPFISLELYEIEEVYDGWVKVTFSAREIQFISTYCFAMPDKTWWIPTGTEILISDPVYEVIDGPNFTRYYTTYDGGFIQGADKNRFTSLDVIENEVEVGDGESISSYYKISVTEGVFNIGFSYNLDKEEMANATHVVFYMKSQLSLSLGFYNADMNSAWYTYWQVQGLSAGEWNKITIPVDTAKQIIKYGFFINGEDRPWFEVGNEIWVSDAIYEDNSDEYDYRVSYWAGGPWVTNSSGISDVVEKETVQEQITVTEGITIDEYDLITVKNESIWTIATYIIVDMDRLTKDGITIFVKANPSCHFAAFDPNGEALYPWNAWSLTSNDADFVKSYDTTTGWTKIVIDKAFVVQCNGKILVGFQLRNGTNSNDSNWGVLPDNFALETEIAISKVIYESTEPPKVIENVNDFRVSYWDTNWYTNQSNLTNRASVETIKETTNVADGITINEYDKVVISYGAVWTLGSYLNIDMSLVGEEGITLYVKADPSCHFAVFDPNGDAVYPWNAWLLTSNDKDFVKSYDATTGWTKIVIDKAFIEQCDGRVLIGFQSRTGTNGNNTNWGHLPDTFAVDTTICVSRIIYE